MQDPRFMSSSQAQTTEIDAGLRAYMLGVYNHMTIALAFTGLFAIGIKMFAGTISEPTALGYAIYYSPLN